MPKPWILLIGGGGHAKACIDVIEQEDKYRIYGIIDGYALQNHQTQVLNYPILGGDEILEAMFKKVQCALIAVGQITTPTPRINIYQNLKRIGYNLPYIISPLAHIARNVQISEGSIIMHHALINTDTIIGKACIINSKAHVEHDCKIGDFCHLSTASVVNGGCTIGERSFVGSNMIIPHATHLALQSLLYSNPLESHPRYIQATDLESQSLDSKHLTGGGDKVKVRLLSSSQITFFSLTHRIDYLSNSGFTDSIFSESNRDSHTFLSIYVPYKAYSLNSPIQGNHYECA